MCGLKGHCEKPREDDIISRLDNKTYVIDEVFENSQFLSFTDKSFREFDSVLKDNIKDVGSIVGTDPSIFTLHSAEGWQPTCFLRWETLSKDGLNGIQQLMKEKTLMQLWKSNLGNEEWREV